MGFAWECTYLLHPEPLPKRIHTSDICMNTSSLHPPLFEEKRNKRYCGAKHSQTGKQYLPNRSESIFMANIQRSSRTQSTEKHCRRYHCYCTHNVLHGFLHSFWFCFLSLSLSFAYTIRDIGHESKRKVVKNQNLYA